jgi:hypothetical protein
VTLAINYSAKKNGLFNGGARTGRKNEVSYPRDVYKLNILFLETYAYISSRKGRKTGLNASLFIYICMYTVYPKVKTGSMEQTPCFTLTVNMLVVYLYACNSA